MFKKFGKLLLLLITSLTKWIAILAKTAEILKTAKLGNSRLKLSRGK